MDLIRIEELIVSFKKLPKEIEEPTYLELCRYPKRRFEEICSRLLCFYLNPYEIHNLGDLFISSLFQLTDEQYHFSHSIETLKIIDEENAERRRIDIVIEDKEFVIGIENKIDAILYNDLRTYSTHLNNKKKKTFEIVLSLNPILIPKNDNHNFKNITYRQYFTKVRANIGNYIIKANSKYLAYALDFIKTIENLQNMNFMNKELDSFFLDNSEELESVIQLYNQYKNKLRQAKLNEARNIVIRMKDLTQDPGWRTYEAEGCSSVIYEIDNLGIEATFSENKKSSLGEFIINVTTWNQAAYNKYSSKINETFKYQLLKNNERGHKHFFVYKSVSGEDAQLITENLLNIYVLIQQINFQD